jgi:alanyl-tRNA synthetase
VGYNETETTSRVLAVVARPPGEQFANSDGEQPAAGAELFDIVIDRTPFYAEGGGQVGDTGIIDGTAGKFRVLDTTTAIEGLTRHTGYHLEGMIEPGAVVTAGIDVARRAAIRRNHTATHLLQDALRTVLGAHVQQQGSLVTPDRLRFDFSHFAGLDPEERSEVERRVNAAILTNEPVLIYETTKSAAEEAGAIAFFDDKYGSVVRVVEAGSSSVELCGGTHVSALGMIGPFKILSEGSIGANTRRIEATTGERSFEAYAHLQNLLDRAAEELKTTAGELPEAIDRLIERHRQLEEDLRAIRVGQLADEARALAATAEAGRLVHRRDGLDPTELRELAIAIRNFGLDALALVGSPDGEKVALVVATSKESGVDARAVASEAAAAVGGGGGGSPQLATAGGRDATKIDDALERLHALIGAG